jgi:hypothetical protein
MTKPLVTVLFLFLLACLATAGGAQAALCPAPKANAKVEIVYLNGEPAFDHSVDQAGLRDINSRIDGYPHGTWHRPLGLTASQLGQEYQTEFRFRKASAGGYCVSLARAKISVGYREMTVYVSRDYPEDSCEYQAVLDHELEHVAINQSVLQAFKVKIKRAVARTLNSHRAIRVYNKAEAQSAYILAFKRQLEPLIKSLQSERKRRNGAIDTADSYRRILARCENW